MAQVQTGDMKQALASQLEYLNCDDTKKLTSALGVLCMLLGHGVPAEQLPDGFEQQLPRVLQLTGSETSEVRVRRQTSVRHVHSGRN
jgi:hypothetical protein